MVGAGRFERPTPCAQDIGCPHLGINKFNNLRTLLVGPCGNFSYNGLLAAGKKYHTLGILNTGWTDSAQTIYRMSLPGLALGAVAGWQSEPVNSNTFFGDYAAQMYPAAVAAEVAPALEELATAEEL